MKKSSFLVFILTFFIGYFPNLIYANTLEIKDKHKYVLGNYLEIFEDHSGSLGISDITKPEIAKEFIKSSHKNPNFGFASSSFWVKTTLKNQSNRTEWLVELDYPMMDLIEFYIPTTPNNFQIKKAGDIFPFSQRERKSRTFTFDLKLEKGEEKTIYLKFESKGSMYLPLNLWSKDEFYFQKSQEQIIFGLYYGIIVVMVIYNLIFFMALRDKTYLYFVFFIGIYGVNQMTLNGFAFEYLWPNLPQWNNFALPFLVAFSIFWGLNFSGNYLITEENTPRLHKCFRYLMGASLLIMFASFFVSYKISVVLVTLLALAFAVIVLPTGIVTYRCGYRPARYFLLAWTFFLIGTCLYAMGALGIIPIGFLTLYSIQIGSALGAILLSLGLADRINTMKLEKEMAQEEALENLKKADKLKDEFLANTSHELKTPLNGIIGLAESMLEGAAGTLSKPQNINISMIASCGKRLTNLINDILDFSKLKEGDLALNKKKVGLSELINFIFVLTKPLLNGKNLRLINEVPDGLKVYADENRLQQILFNLIGNAVKFTDSGKVTVTTKQDGETIFLSVSDTGIGIPKNKLEEIFESFKQADASSIREFGGTGLGLTVTKQLVELHGGTVSVKSEVGKGSVFTVTLQAYVTNGDEEKRGELVPQRLMDSEKYVGEEMIPEPEALERKKQFRILIVDDEQINIQVLKNYLNLFHYSVESAYSGKEALEIIEGSDKFHLVLLDVMMPKMSGYDVCREIRKKFSAVELPIIMLTAKNQVADLVEGFSAGANDYLTKPFVQKELIARIRTHIQLAIINYANSRFVPYEFLKQLEKESIVEVQLGDHIEKEMVVLFSDIRSFTSMSEKMTPEENFNFINEYLGRVGPIIRQNNGFIDKYIGDAIMALFGDPDDALRTSIQMQREVLSYNQERQKNNLGEINIGIGIHRGNLMLGTVGEKERFEGTVISDTVNLASRVESLTKDFGAQIIITQELLQALNKPECYKTRPLGAVAVRGKSQNVSILEVLDVYSLEKQQCLNKSMEIFSIALQSFQKGDYVEAAKMFRQALEINPNDTAAKYYLKQCK